MLQGSSTTRFSVTSVITTSAQEAGLLIRISFLTAVCLLFGGLQFVVRIALVWPDAGREMFYLPHAGRTVSSVACTKANRT